MLLPGTYANGFAPRDGRPLYPSLWKGCVGAWNPGLGVSGLTLRDNSGFQNNGTLTNGPTWAASQGKYALTFDGSNDFVSLAANYNSLDASNAWTISLWFKSNGAVAYGGIVQFGYFGIAQSSDAKFQILRTAGNVSARQRSSTSITTGLLVNLIAVVSGVDSSGGSGGFVDTNSNIYLNGVLNNGLFSSDGNYAPATKIGAQYAGTNAELNDIRVYNRALSPQEIRTLATRRGIAYEMAPRRRSSLPVAVTTNRRRRIIIGGNR